MELHHLRYLIAIAETGSVTAAAQRLHVAQSGVSSQIGKLERELGFPLLRRVGRGIAVTPDGEAIVQVAREAMAAVERVTLVAAERRGVVTGSIRVGTVTGLTWPAVFDAFAELHSRYPGVDVRLSEGTSSELLDGVAKGMLDVAVAAWSGGLQPGLHADVVVDNALVAVVATGHPWASRSRIRPTELAEADLITFPVGAGARDALDAAAARVGRRIVPRWEVSNPESVALLAQRGLGVGIVSESTAEDWPLVRVQISDPLARSVLGVVWRDTPSPATARLLAALAAGVQAGSVGPDSNGKE